MVVVSIQVNLIDVPSGVDVVAVGVEHDEHVQLGVLKDLDGLFVAFVPGVDVPFCRQPSQRRTEVFVAVVPAIDVDDFLGRTVGFGLHGPVRKANDPERFAQFRFTRTGEVDDVRMVVGPLVHLHREGGPCQMHVAVDGLSGPHWCLGRVVLGCCWRQCTKQHANNQADGYSHGPPSVLQIKNTCMPVVHQSEVKALGLATFSPSRVQMLAPSPA